MADLRVQILVRALKELGEYLGKQFVSLNDSVKKEIGELKTAVGEIKQEPMEVKVQVSSIKAELDNLVTQIERISAPEIDLSKLEKILSTPRTDKELSAKIEKLVSAVSENKSDSKVLKAIQDLGVLLKTLKPEKADKINLEPVISAVESLGEKIEKLKIDFPKEIKLDRMQVAEMSKGGRGTVISGATGITERSFQHGAKSSIGATALAMTTVKTKAVSGVMIKADPDNSGTVYVGTDANVTAGTTDATDGFPLSAGDVEIIPVYDASGIYLIASGAGQKVYWKAV